MHGASVEDSLEWIESREARLLLALFLGLLLGIERERRKRERGLDSTAGLRTFGIAALLGGLASYSGVPYLVPVGAIVVGVLVAVGYAFDPTRAVDKGLTTEIALLLAYVLGVIALSRPIVAGAATIVTVALLRYRSALHHFAQDVVSDDELHDALLLLVFAFIVLPLAPDVHVGPYRAIHPQSIARLVFLIALISSAGHVAQRAFGARLGLVAAGFASGFVSSSATIGALGVRARADAALVPAAASGAVASSIATVVQYLVIIAAIDVSLLAGLWFPLGLAAAAAIGATYVLARGGHAASRPDLEPSRGRAVRIGPAMLVAVGSALVAVLAAAVSDAIGAAGIVIVSALSGLVDAHATTASVSTLHQAASLDSRTASYAILGALSANTVTKMVMAIAAGPRGYAVRVCTAVTVIAGAAWLGLLVRV